MNEIEFNQAYLPDTKCKVTYKDDTGAVRIGLLLDGVQTSLTGNQFVYVDSFVNRPLVRDIIRVESLGVKWV